jgi:DNA-binding protein Fis
MSVYEQANQIDTSNYLGINNSSFKNNLYKCALSTPSVYFDTRQNVIETVKRDALKQLYKTIYDLMLNGTDQNGVFLFLKDSKGRDVKPGIAIHTINNFALSATQTMENILDDLVEEYLMPINFDSILNRKFSQQGLATNPQA